VTSRAAQGYSPTGTHRGSINLLIDAAADETVIEIGEVRACLYIDGQAG